MKVISINIGSRNVNFIKEDKSELTYEWLLQFCVRPYLDSHNLDSHNIYFVEATERKIIVFEGMQIVGEIDIIEMEE